MELRSSGMERNHRYGRKSNVKEEREYNQKLCYCSLEGTVRMATGTSL